MVVGVCEVEVRDEGEGGVLRNPLLKRRATVLRYLILPVPVVFLLCALAPHLSSVSKIPEPRTNETSGLGAGCGKCRKARVLGRE